jgi:uncharacterized protein (TIGR02996 family)
MLGTAELSFLRAIGDEPEADEPRLVFADWLEDRGNPWAELIRLQCARESPVRQSELDPREACLVRQFWDEDWQGLKAYGVEAGRLRRGLVEELIVDVEKWREHAPTLRAQLPTVRTLRLRNVSEKHSLPELLGPADWPMLKELAFFGCEFDLPLIRELGRCERLRSIDSLGLRACRLSLESLFVLSQPPFQFLEALDLGGNALTDTAVTALCQRPTCGTLRSLTLDGNHITDAGFAELMTSPSLFALRVLRLSGNAIHLGPEWARTVGMPMPHLHTVDLSGNRLGGFGDMHLGEATGFMRVKTLLLDRCRLTPADVSSILPLRVLSELSLNENPLGNAGIAALADNPHFRLLRTLGLAGTEAGDIAADCLVASPSLAPLQRLDLRSNSFSPPAVRALKERFGDRVQL